jgi:hypothetical protein
MSDLFREVDEELKQDRAKSLARRWGPLVGSVVAVVLVATAGWTLWDRWQQSRAESATAALIETLSAQGADPATTADRLAVLADEAGGAHETLAVLNEASMRAEAGDTAAAVALYTRVAEDGGADPVFRDLARLALVMHQLGEADPADLAARLEPLAAADSPWRFTARELQALVALEAGDTDRARALAAELAEAPQAPPGVRTRAGDLRDFLAER